jgi:hypothetical protein
MAWLEEWSQEGKKWSRLFISYQSLPILNTAQQCFFVIYCGKKFTCRVKLNIKPNRIPWHTYKEKAVGLVWPSFTLFPRANERNCADYVIWLKNYVQLSFEYFIIFQPIVNSADFSNKRLRKKNI